MCKRAVILAGGLGTRLRPYTLVLPKPLMPIGEYPILEVVVRQLADAGFERITLAVNHQAEIIKAYFQDGARWGIHIDYTLELSPLGTMGPLKLITDLPENFLVMNGDVLTDLDYRKFHESHCEKSNLFTISSKTRINKIDYGVLEVNSKNILTGFREKPTESFHVSMGIYMANTEILSFIPENKAYGFDQLMVDLLSIGRPANVHPFAGYWLDIGRPDDYESAIDVFNSERSKFLKN